jgi:hypothetical protein
MDLWEKEAEIVSKNLFRIHSQQKVIFLCSCWGVGGDCPIRADCIGMASPPRRRRNTAWIRLLDDIGRIFSFPPLPPVRKYGLESQFDRFRPYFFVSLASVKAEIRPIFEFY